MKQIFTLFSVFLSMASVAQTIVFSDDFESGTSNWVLTGQWGTSTLYSNSTSHSLTESPVGNYLDQITTTAAMATGVNLTTAISADVSFYAIYDLESAFDYTYLEVTTNNGLSWNTLATFTGDNQLSPWVQYTYSLGGYVGSASVRLRFRFVSDQAVNEDGMYIDDFVITSYATDISPPLIQHTAPVHYESNTGSQSLTASIVDISGVSSAKLFYKVDNGNLDSLSGINTVGNNYVFVIPSQVPGAWVDYYIRAIDNSTAMNADSTPWHSYIAGNYIKYDNGQVDFVNSAGPGAVSGVMGMAVRITLPSPTNLVTALIRNYTDPNRPNDSIHVHIWANNNGVPGADLVTPILVNPEATLSSPNLMTRVDLRPYAAQLSTVTGDVFVGYTVPSGEAWTQQTTPGVANRTFTYNGSFWVQITDDYHFRVITGPYQGVPSADFTWTAITDPQIIFADQSSNNPTTWYWDFDDNGANSTQQNPVYTFSENRTFNVCLTAGNLGGNTQICKLLNITGVPPDAAFTWTAVNDPQVDFTDASPDTAISWHWDFGDGQQSIVQNPSHIYSSNGSFNACLTITTTWGTSNPYCDTITVAKVGLAENSASQVEIYPNPFHERFTLEATQQISSLEILDAAGRKVQADYFRSGNLVHIDAGKLPAGYYRLMVIWEDGSAGTASLIAY